MSELDNPRTTPSEQRRSEWTKRVDSFARDAAPRTRPFAEALVAIVAPPRGASVLDVATGSGIVAVEAGKLVGATGTVLATDFVPEWEPYVVASAAEAGLTNVTFATMPAEALDLPDASVDVVLCQFGLMFVADPVQVLRELRRVLRPGGTLGLAVWSVPKKVGIFLIAGIVSAAMPPPPADGSPSPMGMSTPGVIEGLVAQAGFSNIVAELVTHSFEVINPNDEWQSWSEGGSQFAVGLADLPETEQARIRNQAIAALERFRDGAVIRVPSEAILVRASR